MPDIWTFGPAKDSTAILAVALALGLLLENVTPAHDPTPAPPEAPGREPHGPEPTPTPTPRGR